MVRPLPGILVGGTVAFMALAMAQEWSVFDEAWFGSADEAPVLPEAQQREASDTVYQALSLMGHLYSSAGDPRFAERMPVSDGVRQEIQADLDYLRLNQRRQELALERLDVTAIDTLGAERVEVRTREIWSTGTGGIGEDADAIPDVQRQIYGTYRLVRGPRGWRVESWEPSEPWREPGTTRAGEP